MKTSIKQYAHKLAIVPLALASIITMGCGENNTAGTTSSISFSTPQTLMLAAAAVPGITATLDVDGIQAVGPTPTKFDGSVTFTMSGLSLGMHTFQINYFSSGLQIFQAGGRGNVSQNIQNTINLDPQACPTAKCDTDDDGVNNLVELQIGTNPRDHASKPAVAVAVAAGANHTCALIANGTVQCWGKNDSGQLGNNSTSNSSTPVPVSNMSTGVLVPGGNVGRPLEAGFAHTCVLLTQTNTILRAVSCWGDNGLGQLGNGQANNTTVRSLVPVNVSGIVAATSLAAGDFHTCARLVPGSTKSLACWGNNSDGQLGDNTTTTRLLPVTIGVSDPYSVGAGPHNTCVVTGNNRVICWGYNGQGELGIGNQSVQINAATAPAVVSNDDAWGFPNTVGVGDAFACELRKGGDATFCWGAGNVELGDGRFHTFLVPPVLVQLPVATEIAVGHDSSCAALSDGTVACWGRNNDGKLGIGNTTNQSAPKLVAGISTATSVTVGGNHACALLDNNSVQCWGLNDSGQLGDGTTSTSFTPVTVVGLLKVP